MYCWKFIFYFLDQKLQVAVINCLAGLVCGAGLTATARRTALQLLGGQPGE
jgi:hypothetical protein